MKNKTDKAPALRCEARVRRSVMPTGLALSYIDPRNGPYKMIIRDDGAGGWATLYKDRRKVWGCNDIFAAVHFYDYSPNTAGEPMPGTTRSKQ